MQPDAAFPARVRLPDTERWDVRSRAGRAYRIFLAWPDTPPPDQGWDVVYLLDGNAWFGTLRDSLRMQARRPAVTGVRPAVVVGVGYPTDDVVDVDRRRYDLTPPLPPGAAASASGDGAVGGADAFRDFLADELGPMVEARFGLRASRRVVFGHSLGGLFVLHALLTRPAAFAAYAAASPSIWFGDRAVLRTAETARRPGSLRLMITVGALEQPSPQASDPMPGGGPNRAMVDNARSIAERLGDGPAGHEVRFHVFEGENHASVVPAAISRALPFLLARPIAAG